MLFNKRGTSTAERGNVNIGQVFEGAIGDLSEVVKILKEKIEDQLC